MCQSKLNALLINMKNVIMIELVSEGETVYRKYKRKERESYFFENDSFILNCENMPVHKIVVVKQISPNECIPLLEHPLFSLNLSLST